MKKMISGIKPTGDLTLGNYLGALKPFIKFQETYDMTIFVANLHAITVKQDPNMLVKTTKDLIALYLACGLDKDKCTLFLQTDILEHAQLGFILTCLSSMGELSRMTQYKDKVSKDENIEAGMFVYPALMAADILLYDADFVPVGDDQAQHVELTRTLAQRFNHRYGTTFKIPQTVTQTVGARIMSLQDPTKKMSKSDPSPKGCIYLLDDVNVAKKKIKSAITDTDTRIYFDPINKPGISNLMSIYACLTDKSLKDIELLYQGATYGAFKHDLAQIVGDCLEVIQAKYHAIIDSGQIDIILKHGAIKAKTMAAAKLAEVEKNMGLKF